MAGRGGQETLEPAYFSTARRSVFSEATRFGAETETLSLNQRLKSRQIEFMIAGLP